MSKILVCCLGNGIVHILFNERGSIYVSPCRVCRAYRKVHCSLVPETVWAWDKSWKSMAYKWYHDATQVDKSDVVPDCCNSYTLHWLDSSLPNIDTVFWTLPSQVSLVPRPPPFFVLRFAFSVIHGSGRVRKIILNTNQRTKNGGGLGTRLISSYNNKDLRILRQAPPLICLPIHHVISPSTWPNLHFLVYCKQSKTGWWWRSWNDANCK